MKNCKIAIPVTLNNGDVGNVILDARVSTELENIRPMLSVKVIGNPVITLIDNSKGDNNE